MLPHRLDADGVARGVFNLEIFARLRGDLIGGSLCLSDGYARLQSANHAHRNGISLLGVVAKAIGEPDIGRGFQIRGRREVNLKVGREDSHDSRTEGLSPYLRTVRLQRDSNRTGAGNIRN